MRTKIPERLVRVADEIGESGSASLTRITVLKKWFEQEPKRLRAFAVFLASRASARKGKTSGEAADLFREARGLLKDADIYEPQIPEKAAEDLFLRLKSFQNEFQKQHWGAVRILKNHNLYLVEEGLRIYLHSDSAADGYRLAASYCQNYDPRFGNSLNGPSATKIHEIVRFMITIEAREECSPS